jgi:MoaA/NifB/PqqE/SkfB family radical SAM enzyme
MRKSKSDHSSNGFRCRHAFETVTVHANGEVVCSIIDGRGDFVIGNVYEQSLREIFNGPDYRKLRELVISTKDDYCRAIGKRCPLKTIPSKDNIFPETEKISYLAIEPTTACDLACLTCPVRDFVPTITWRDAFKDGGYTFLAWDTIRRIKQHTADFIRHVFPLLPEASNLSRTAALLLRGRVHSRRNGTLPLEVIKRVIDEAGSHVIRVDFFNYGEPFLYRHLIEALDYIRNVLPRAHIAISTNGNQVTEKIEDLIIQNRLVDWILFSIDGISSETYGRYRIGGNFMNAFNNLLRFNRKAQNSGIHVVWQYVVFNWNDNDLELKRAIEIAHQENLTLWFDFANTWGRSSRKAADLRFLTPYLKPFTALPDEPRQEGW